MALGSGSGLGSVVRVRVRVSVRVRIRIRVRVRPKVQGVPLVACLIPASAHCGMCAMASLNIACRVCAALPAHLGGGASSAGGYSLVKCRLSRDLVRVGVGVRVRARVRVRVWVRVRVRVMVRVRVACPGTSRPRRL